MGVARCALWLAMLSGCGHTVTVPVECTEQLAGTCVGVETAADDLAGACLCDGEPKVVEGRAELLAALAGEPACISLLPAPYGSVTLTSGFILVGETVENVVLDELRFEEGTASACRMTIEHGVHVSGRADAIVQYARVYRSPSDGVLVEHGGSARIVGTTIEKSARYGVSALQGARWVTIQRSVIAGDQAGPGVWVECPGGCACLEPPPALFLSDSIVRDSAQIGVSVVGAVADLQRVHISETAIGSNFTDGGGLSVSGCAILSAADLEVHDNLDFGVLIDDSTATLERVDIRRNLRGLWASHISLSRPASVRVANVTLAENIGTGLGIGGDGTGPVVVEDGAISSTRLIALPILVEGVSASSELVADGVLWRSSAVVQLKRLVVRQSERLGVHIVGPASGSLEDVTLAGGDELCGIVHEGDGPAPTTSGSTPDINAGDCP